MDETGKRIVLADDDTLLREGIASLLQGVGFDIIGQAHDAAELLTLVREQQPDLAIIDIRMPPDYLTEGLDAARQIREQFPSTGILVLSAHAEVDEAMELLAAGYGVGYLLKSRVTDIADFAETVARIAAGGCVVDPALVQELVAARHRDDAVEQLTERERDVLKLMAEGRSNAGIAHRLWITEGTVEKHVRSILARLQLPETEDDHRRVLAVLAFLESRLGPCRRRAAPDDGQDCLPGQGALRQERDSRGVRHHVAEILRGIGGDEDHARLIGASQAGELARNLEARLLAKVNVEQDNVRLQLTAGSACLRSRRRHPDHSDPGPLQEVAGGAQEVTIVVDDQATHGHGPRLPHEAVPAIAASWKAGPPGSLH